MTTLYSSPMVAAAAKQLLGVARAPSKEDANQELVWFEFTAAESEEHFAAAFLAAQTLRDLGRIDPDEAAFVFDSLFDTGDGKVEQFAFYEAHGESELARMHERDPKAYDGYTGNGFSALIGDRPPRDDRAIVDSPSSVAAVTERALAFFAAVSRADRLNAWNNLVRVASRMSVGAAVSAIRSLREIGTVSVAESAGLIDIIIGATVDRLCDEDRGISRLRRAASPEGKKTIGGTKVDRARLSAAQRRLTARTRRIKVAYLRQIGEHHLASMLLSEPLAYELLVMHGPVVELSGSDSLIQIKKEIDGMLGQ